MALRAGLNLAPGALTTATEAPRPPFVSMGSPCGWPAGRSFMT